MTSSAASAAVDVRGATDAGWRKALWHRVAERLPGVMAGRPGLASLELLADDVWLARLTDGGKVVVKHHFFGLLTRGQPYDLAQTEADVLEALMRAGCPVPTPLGVDSEAQVTYLEYAGPRSLSQVLAGARGAASRARRTWARRLLAGLVEIEAALAPQGRWEDRTVPGGSRDDLARAWGAAGREAMAGLELVAGRLGVAAPVAREARGALAQVTAELGGRPATLGPVDYQPGNIVVDEEGQRLTFLELGKLGWDWTERRAVQYATRVLPPVRPGLIDGLAAAAYEELWADEEVASRRRALDGHHLVFHLLWASRGFRSGRKAAALEPVLAALATPLSDDAQCGTVRRCLAVARGAP